MDKKGYIYGQKRVDKWTLYVYIAHKKSNKHLNKEKYHGNTNLSR